MVPGVSGFSRRDVKEGNVRNLTKEASGKNFGDGTSKFGGIQDNCKFYMGKTDPLYSIYY